MYPSKNTITINKIISGLIVLKIHQIIPIAAPNPKIDSNKIAITFGVSFNAEMFFAYFSGFSYFCLNTKKNIKNNIPEKYTIGKSHAHLSEKSASNTAIPRNAKGDPANSNIDINFNRKSSFCFAKSILSYYHNINLKSTNPNRNLNFA